MTLSSLVLPLPPRRSLFLRTRTVLDLVQQQQHGVWLVLEHVVTGTFFENIVTGTPCIGFHFSLPSTRTAGDAVTANTCGGASAISRPQFYLLGSAVK